VRGPLERDEPVETCDTLVIGGGFYGAVLAQEMAKHSDVVLLEREPQLLSRASWTNQARIHLGYHYPRSFLTARRSLQNAPRFMEDYRDCVVDTFRHYYAIAKHRSNVTAGQFRVFCGRVGAQLRVADESVMRLFNPALIEAVFEVVEPAFDATALRATMLERLARSGVDVRLGTEARSVSAAATGNLEVRASGASAEQTFVADRVFNCTYARLNAVLVGSELPTIPLKHELAELVLIEPPACLADRAVTVMCGPFFSCMPFPPEGLHSLSHVRYTPHRSWTSDRHGGGAEADATRLEPPESHSPSMLRDAARYLPCMAESRVIRSLWEIKTLLPRSEVDDSRPILVRRDHGLPGLTCIAGAKLDNVYDVLEALDAAARISEEAR